jgi:hypothetical protein
MYADTDASGPAAAISADMDSTILEGADFSLTTGVGLER